MKTTIKLGTAFAFLAILTFTSTASFAANKYDAGIRSIVASKIMPWLDNAMVINAIKAQNAKHAGLSEAQIIKLDKQWRAETKSGSKPLIDKVLGNSLSGYLKKVKSGSKGLFTEIFVMDNKGINVGQSDITSDYWQGDEAKWKKTYKVGPEALLIGKVKKDESTQRFQVQVSLAVTDPASKGVVGAVTIGIDMESSGL